MLEHVDNSVGNPISYVHIYANWDVLARYAEIMALRMPMKTIQSNLKLLFDEETNADSKAFTTVFTREKEYLFDIPEHDREDFFTPSQRAEIIDYILRRTKFDQNNDVFSIGINKLLADRVYDAAYPLHDVGVNCKFECLFSETKTFLQAQRRIVNTNDVNCSRIGPYSSVCFAFNLSMILLATLVWRFPCIMHGLASTLWCWFQLQLLAWFHSCTACWLLAETRPLWISVATTKQSQCVQHVPPTVTTPKCPMAAWKAKQHLYLAIPPPYFSLFSHHFGWLYFWNSGNDTRQWLATNGICQTLAPWTSIPDQSFL